MKAQLAVVVFLYSALAHAVEIDESGIGSKAASRNVNCFCQCAETTFRDKYNRIHGNCRTADSSNAKWCYVDSRYNQCSDLRRSSRPGLEYSFISYEACATPELSDPRCRYGGYGGNYGSGGFGSSGNFGSGGYGSSGNYGSGGFGSSGNFGSGSFGGNGGFGSSGGYGSGGFGGNGGYGSSGGYGSGSFGGNGGYSLSGILGGGRTATKTGEQEGSKGNKPSNDEVQF